MAARWLGRNSPYIGRNLGRVHIAPGYRDTAKDVFMSRPPAHVLATEVRHSLAAVEIRKFGFAPAE